MELWMKRAKRFIWEQRATELRRAISRYPNSDYYQRRVDELNDLEEKLKTLESQSRDCSDE